MADIVTIKEVKEVTATFSEDEFRLLMSILDDNEASEEKFPGVWALWESLDDACKERGIEYLTNL